MTKLNKWWPHILWAFILIGVSALVILYLCYEPSTKSANFEKCKELNDQKDYKACIECLDEYISKYPEDEALKMRGEAHYYNGDYREAVDDFSEFLGTNRTNRKVYYLRGEAYIQLGRRERALYDFKKSCDFGYEKACERLNVYEKSKPAPDVTKIIPEHKEIEDAKAPVKGSSEKEVTKPAIKKTLEIPEEVVTRENLNEISEKLDEMDYLIDRTSLERSKLRDLSITSNSINETKKSIQIYEDTSKNIHYDSYNVTITRWESAIDENNPLYPEWEEVKNRWDRTYYMWTKVSEDWVSASNEWEKKCEIKLEYYRNIMNFLNYSIIIFGGLLLIILVHSFFYDKNKSAPISINNLYKNISIKHVVSGVLLGLLCYSLRYYPIEFYAIALITLIYLYLLFLSRPFTGVLLSGCYTIITDASYAYGIIDDNALQGDLHSRFEPVTNFFYFHNSLFDLLLRLSAFIVPGIILGFLFSYVGYRYRRARKEQADRLTEEGKTSKEQKIRLTKKEKIIAISLGILFAITGSVYGTGVYIPDMITLIVFACLFAIAVIFFILIKIESVIPFLTGSYLFIFSSCSIIASLIAGRYIATDPRVIAWMPLIPLAFLIAAYFSVRVSLQAFNEFTKIEIESKPITLRNVMPFPLFILLYFLSIIAVSAGREFETPYHYIYYILPIIIIASVCHLAYLSRPLLGVVFGCLYSFLISLPWLDNLSNNVLNILVFGTFLGFLVSFISQQVRWRNHQEKRISVSEVIFLLTLLVIIVVASFLLEYFLLLKPDYTAQMIHPAKVILVSFIIMGYLVILTTWDRSLSGKPWNLMVMGSYAFVSSLADDLFHKFHLLKNAMELSDIITITPILLFFIVGLVGYGMFIRNSTLENKLFVRLRKKISVFLDITISKIGRHIALFSKLRQGDRVRKTLSILTAAIAIPSIGGIILAAAFILVGEYIILPIYQRQMELRPETEMLIQSYHFGSAEHLAVSSDGKYLVSSGSDKTLRLWDGKNTKLLKTVLYDEGIKKVSFSPDGKFIYIANGSGGFVILDSKNMKEMMSSQEIEDKTKVSYKATIFNPVDITACVWKLGEIKPNIVNKKGNIIIENAYDIGESSEGLIPLCLGDKYGYINKNGDIVIHPIFDGVAPFSEGLAGVMVNEKIGFINRKGEFIVKPIFDDAEGFSEGYALIRMKSRYGFIDEYGNLLIDPRKDERFVDGKSFSDGYAALKRVDGKWGFIEKEDLQVDKKHKWKRLEEIEVIKEVNDKKKLSLFEYQFEDVGSFSEGLAPIKLNGKWGYVDTSGYIAVEPIYDAAEEFEDGLAEVGINKEDGFIDRSGKEVIKPGSIEFGLLVEFSEGLIAFEKNERYGFVNNYGKIIVEPIFDKANDFSEGLAVVRVGTKYGFIGKDGKFEIEPIYDLAFGFHNGIASVMVDSKWGCIDKSGNFIISPKYNFLVSHIEGDIFYAGSREIEGAVIDLKTGKEMLTLEHSDLFWPMPDPFFSPDGSLICLKHREKVYLWKTKNGKLADTLDLRDYIMDIRFSDDSKFLMLKLKSNRVIVVEIRDGHFVIGKPGQGEGRYYSEFNLPEDTEQVDIKSISQDMTYAVLHVEKKALKDMISDTQQRYALGLWDIKKGIEIRTFELKLRDNDSPDVKAVLLNNNTLMTASLAKPYTIQLWDIETGKLNREVNYENISSNYWTVFKNSRVFSACSDGTIKTWDLNADQDITPPVGSVPKIDKFLLAPDSEHIFISNKLGDDVYSWDFSKGKVKKLESDVENENSRESKESGIYSVCAARDGSILTVGIKRNSILVFRKGDGGNLDLVKEYTGEDLGIRSGDSIAEMTCSRDGKYLGIITDSCICSVIDITKGNEIIRYERFKDTNKLEEFITDNFYQYTEFSPDSTFVVFGLVDTCINKKMVIVAYDIEAGKNIYEFSNDLDWKSSHRGAVFSFFLSDSLLAIPTSNDRITVYDLSKDPLTALKDKDSYNGNDETKIEFERKGVPVKEIPLKEYTYMAYDGISADGKTIVASVKDNKKMVMEADMSSEPRYIDIKEEDTDWTSISNTGRYLVSGRDITDTEFSILRRIVTYISILYEQSYQRILGKVTDPHYTEMSFLPEDDRFLSFVCSDRYILTMSTEEGYPLNIWDWQKGKLVISLLNFTDGNWIVYTPDGYFDCSPDAAKYVTWKVGDEVYAFDQYWEEYYVPDLLYKVLHGEFVPSEKLDIPVPPSVEILDPTDRIEVKGNTTTITARVTDDVKVEEVVVAVNGRPINSTVRDAIEFTENTDKSVTFKATVPLTPGPNVIEVYAYDDRKTRSWEEKVYVTSTGASEGASNLYVLAIGVSEYMDQSYNLGYAADDAKSIVDILKSQKDLLYSEIKVHLLTDKEATTKNVLNAMTEIRKTITMNDVLVIFMAGHGVKDKGYKFYFLTHDAQLGDLTSTALGWADFQVMLRDTPARNVIMMLDSCHSGAALDPKSPFITADRLIGNIEKKSGVIVISSSTGSEVSIESPEWKHGAFTYALIEALKGKADFIKDKKIFVGEMNLYVPSRVKELTKDRQTPSIPRLENFTDFAITEIL